LSLSCPRALHSFPTRRSSDLAAVSAGGLVSALVAGTSTVTATSEGISGSAPLTVTLLPPPTSGSWANEPAGFTTITDYDVGAQTDRKSTRLNSSHQINSYAVF